MGFHLCICFVSHFSPSRPTKLESSTTPETGPSGVIIPKRNNWLLRDLLLPDPLQRGGSPGLVEEVLLDEVPVHIGRLLVNTNGGAMSTCELHDRGS